MKPKRSIQTLLKMDIKDIKHYLQTGKAGITAPKAQPQRKVKPLKQTYVVFDIGTTFIQVLVGKQVKGRTKVTHAFQVQTPIGTIEDGKILNEARVAEALAAALTQRQIKAKAAIVTMNSSQIINRDLFIPNVEAEEMETVIRYELQQYLPINLEDYQVRYLTTTTTNQEGKQRIFVSAFPERMLRGYYQVLQQAGFQPYALELPLIANQKLFMNTAKINQQVPTDLTTIALLDFGQQSINISIYHDGDIDFTRLVRSGGQLLDDALRREGMKQEHILAYKMETLNCTDADFATLHPDVKQTLDAMMSEVDKFLQFYRNTNQHKPIDQIYLHGGFAQIKGLDTYLSSLFKMPTQLIQTIDGLELPDGTQSGAIASYVNAMSSFTRMEV